MLTFAATVTLPGWEARKDAKGKVYYVDHNTRTTHWKLPPAARAATTATEGGLLQTARVTTSCAAAQRGAWRAAAAADATHGTAGERAAATAATHGNAAAAAGGAAAALPLAAAELAQSAQRSADALEATLDGLLNKLGLMHLRAVLAAQDILDVSRSLSCRCLRQCVRERE